MEATVPGRIRCCGTGDSIKREESKAGRLKGWGHVADIRYSGK
jgi:hypothetical protein